MHCHAGCVTQLNEHDVHEHGLLAIHKTIDEGSTSTLSSHFPVENKPGLRVRTCFMGANNVSVSKVQGVPLKDP